MDVYSAPFATQSDPMQALAALLLAHGHCDARTLDRGRRVAAESGQRLDRVLIQLGLVSERDLANAYVLLTALPLATPAQFPVGEAPFADRLSVRYLRHAKVLPLGEADGRLLLAVADPLDPFVPASVAAATGMPVDLLVGVPVELDAALDRLFPDPARAGSGHTAGGEPLEEDAERLKDLASEAPVIRLVNGIISRAVETRASDIHIEPFEDRLRVRYRYDGVLHEGENPPAPLTAAIISRIKIMARLDIAERRLPQDGRIKLAVRGQDVDFRVSTVPSLHGESVVLRVLDRSAVQFEWTRLGLSPRVVARLESALQLPNGIVLVTGPTGSGKTTTLYTGLLSLNSVSRKVVTIEDPIEYQLPGVNQIQVKPQIGLNFANLLRNILRQDPDVIMVGEIRDLETAQIAVQAALTGHLVLSTVHTNSAAATIARLRDMGLEDYLITAVLRGVLAQRLVRRLCVECRRAEPAAPELIERLQLGEGARPLLWHPVGCPHCRGTGYRGRLAIAEYLPMVPAIERLIFAGGDHNALEQKAAEIGMVTMFKAGVEAALAGETTLEEVTRSIRAEGLSVGSFRFVALDASGRTTRGTMEAASEAEVVSRLQHQGAIPLLAEPAGGGWWRWFDRELGRRLRASEVANFTRELALMLAAGQDIDRSLRFMAETALNRRVAGVIAALRETVRDGGSLAKALAEHRGSFTRLYVGLVRAGEAGGTLAPTLEHLATLLERQRALAASVTSALIYPALLLVAAVGSITMLLTQVLPQFVPLFAQSGAQLPAPTRLLLAIGDVTSAWWLPATILLLVALLAASQALKQPGPRLRADQWALRLPVFGRLLREIVAARFCRTLGTLLINGVPLIAALTIVQDAVGNRAAVAAIERAAIAAKGGAGLARPLESEALFPARMIHLLRLGEETAQLGPMALRAAEIHEEQTRLGIQRLVALLVPSITVVMGAAIAFIISSLLLAMLGLNDLAAG